MNALRLQDLAVLLGGEEAGADGVQVAAALVEVEVTRRGERPRGQPVMTEKTV